MTPSHSQRPVVPDALIWYHGSDVKLKKLNRGSWVTDSKSIAKTSGKFLYIVDITDNSIDFDIIYSAVENTNEYRGTILKEALVKEVPA
jgi:hypothetical protein